MDYPNLMAELEAFGTEQNRKVYPRHGVKGELFGVSFANLKMLKKKIKQDQSLAQQLWQSGNHDARLLATMIADPAAFACSDLDAWAKDLDNHIVTDYFANLVIQTPYAGEKLEEWTPSENEWLGRAGWHLLAHLAMDDPSLSDAFFMRYLDEIEHTLHERKNRTREAMNNALIAIGVRNPALEKQATAAARKIGKVEIDHGKTGCKTPDAVSYIAKTLEHRAKKKLAHL